MSYPGPGAQPTVLFVDGAPVGAGNPLPVSGGGGSLGTVDQGAAGSDLRLEPGDVLAVALQTASSTATADVSLNWHEE